METTWKSNYDIVKLAEIKEGTRRPDQLDVERLFPFKNNHWKYRMQAAQTPEAKLEVAGQFAWYALSAFIEGSEYFIKFPRFQTNLVKTLDRHAAWMVAASDGIEKDFRLSRSWFRIILVQMSLAGAIEKDEKEDDQKYSEGLIDKISLLWDHYGWDDLADCIDPRFDKIRTTLPVKFATSVGADSEFNIILDPSTEFPIGSIWRAKNGTEWEIVEVKETEKGTNVHCLPEEPPYNEKAFSDIMVRAWERVI